MAKGRMQTNFDGLVKLLAKNLYSESDIFIRELIQNAHDAIKLRQKTDAQIEGRIDISTNENARSITFSDNGAGMNRVEIEEHLATIGVSGTRKKTQQLSEQGVTAETIGQFGVGLLSAFVVAEKIELVTRKKKDGPAFRWVSSGGEEYDLDEIENPSCNTGTTVTVICAVSNLEQIDEIRVRDTIKRYADFLRYKIYLNNEGPVNEVDAPWHKPKNQFASVADYHKKLKEFLGRRYPDIPLHVIPIELEDLHATGAIYISDHHIPDINTTGVIDIFQERMCVRAEDRELLPAWAKFVRGVVDSPDLQPTAARDAIIKNEVYRKLQKALGDLIIDSLKRLAIEEPTRFARICAWHHYHLKGMALQYDDFFNAIINVLPFETNDGEMNFPTYIKRQQRPYPGDLIPVYFFSFGLDANQFYDIARAQGILAINTGRQFDEEVVRKYVSRKSSQLELKQLDALDDKVLYKELTDDERQHFVQLESAVDRALDENRIPVRTRTRRIAPEKLSGVILQTQRMDALEKLKSFTKAAALGNSAMDELAIEVEKDLKRQPVDFYLNADNPLVKRIASLTDLDRPGRRDILVALYNASILNSASRLSPELAKIFYMQIHNQLDTQLNLEVRLDSVLTEISALRDQTNTDTNATDDNEMNHRTWPRLFIMMPYGRDYDQLELALREIFESPPYWMELYLARDKVLERSLVNNLRRHMREADGFIAEATELNENVMMELGAAYLSCDYEKQPIFVLWCQSEAKTEKPPVDLGDLLHIKRLGLTDKNLVASLRKELNSFSSFFEELKKKRPDRYLSDHLMRRAEISGFHIKALRNFVRTYDELLAVDQDGLPDGKLKLTVLTALDALERFQSQ